MFLLADAPTACNMDLTGVQWKEDESLSLLPQHWVRYSLCAYHLTTLRVCTYFNSSFCHYSSARLHSICKLQAQLHLMRMTCLTYAA